MASQRCLSSSNRNTLPENPTYENVFGPGGYNRCVRAENVPHDFHVDEFGVQFAFDASGVFRTKPAELSAALVASIASSDDVVLHGPQPDVVAEGRWHDSYGRSRPAPDLAGASAGGSGQSNPAVPPPEIRDLGLEWEKPAAKPGEKCNVCRLNDTWFDGHCVNPLCPSHDVQSQILAELRKIRELLEDDPSKHDTWGL